MQVQGHADNKVIGTPAEETGSSIVWVGRGARLVIGAGVTLDKAAFRLSSGSEVVIGDGAVVKGQFRVNTGSRVVIGASAKFNKPCRLHAGERCTITIGPRCLLANAQFRTSDSHSIVDIATGQRINPAADIVLEEAVWIAEEVLVYKGVRIGKGSIVGAGSVVTRSIGPYSLAAGVPARVIREGVTWNEELLPVAPRA